MTDLGKKFIEAFAQSNRCLGDECPFKEFCDKKEGLLPMSNALDWESKVCKDVLNHFLNN